MLKQTLFLPLMLTAIGGPFLLMSGKSPLGNSESESDEIDVDQIERSLGQDAGPVYKPVSDLRKVFGFQTSAAQIGERFEQVTTADLQGYKTIRTSVLTGHAKSDLSGSVTYQFDSQERLKRILFNGFTEDPARLIEFVRQEFGLKPSKAPGEFTVGGYSGTSGKLKIIESTRYSGQQKIELLITK